ncbi:hypothetical protein ACFQZI_14910 [Mucilaginibacter lutimaris]|uniref:Uncharacterized protein n=1 Tax=Mucilaginibacter lutimaris TaxID=931629 RepID=A0ABW2ZJ10_9SPHI
MKKQTTNLLLGVAVIVIWGGAGYRLVSRLSDTEEEVPVAPPERRKAADDFAASPDTAHLRLDYRDPFGLVARPVQRDSSRRSVTPRRETIKFIPADMGFVKYAGYIANPGSKRTLTMFMINGKTVMLNEGESAEGIKLLKNLRDSVKVLYRNQVRFITKSS